MSKSITELKDRRAQLVTALAKVDLEIAQSGFIESLIPGAYVFGKLNDGSTFKNARLLGVTKAEGTAGAWYKLRINEDTTEEMVKSVRLSNIEGVEQ